MGAKPWAYIAGAAGTLDVDQVRRRFHGAAMVGAIQHFFSEEKKQKTFIRLSQILWRGAALRMDVHFS
jgi:hypothetical protein